MGAPVKGLFIKDLRLLKNQKVFLAMLLLVWVMLAFLYDDAAFGIGYITLIFSIFTMGTVSYDEMDNGAAYLFTLPVRRKDYVCEKYLFAMLTSAAVWAFTTVGSYVILLCRGLGTDIILYLAQALTLLIAVFLLVAVDLPVQLKFGMEKNRLVRAIVIGVLAGAIAVVSALDGIILAIVRAVSGLSGTLLIAVAVLALIAVVLVSYRISVRIMEKREF